MGLNKSNGNMYGFVTHTWNPLAGECPNKCSYCSTNKLKKRYPLLREKYSGPLRLELPLENLGSGKYIFVVAQNDLFASNNGDYIELYERLITVFMHLAKYPGNKYLIQSKCIDSMRAIFGMNNGLLTDNIVLCTTFETMNHAKLHDAWTFSKIKHPHKHVTIEPIMAFDLLGFMKAMEMINPEQINIGADSGNNNLPEPTSEEVHALIKALIDKGYNVFIKDNLKRLL